MPITESKRRRNVRQAIYDLLKPVNTDMGTYESPVLGITDIANNIRSDRRTVASIAEDMVAKGILETATNGRRVTFWRPAPTVPRSWQGRPVGDADGAPMAP